MRKLQNLPLQLHRRRQANEQGQALLEFALIVPVLFIMLLGVAVMAQGFNLQMVLYGAAYEGARIWAKNPAGGDNIHCTPPACVPGNGDAINFEKYVMPAVRQYVTNNGFDGNKVYFFTTDGSDFREQLKTVSYNPQSVNVTVIYKYELPIGNFAEGFQEILVSASCWLKRGS